MEATEALEFGDFSEQKNHSHEYLSVYTFTHPWASGSPFFFLLIHQPSKNATISRKSKLPESHIGWLRTRKWSSPRNNYEVGSICLSILRPITYPPLQPLPFLFLFQAPRYQLFPFLTFLHSLPGNQWTLFQWTNIHEDLVAENALLCYLPWTFVFWVEP